MEYMSHSPEETEHIGEMLGKRLSGGTVLANVERVDHSTATGTWTAGARYTVSPGQTVTYRVRAGVDTNRSTESGISVSCTIHFE